LTQSFQEWLKQVLTAIKPPSNETAKDIHVDTNGPREFPKPDAVAPAWMSPLVNGIRMDIHRPTSTSCQKLLFSATLTRDPAKIAGLQLRDPRYIIVRGKAHGEENDMDVDESHYMETFETPATLRVRVPDATVVNLPTCI
jgi:ATP-dependent RNA helicase DDX51/DBP6